MSEAVPPLRGLYAITPDEPDRDRLLGMVQQALAGGCPWVQYRDKISSADERRRRAQELLCLCRARGAGLIINDDLQLALAVGADGLHLGRDDGSLAEARAALGQASLLGASCYDDFAAARRAAGAGADYVAFGAVYASPTKPEAPRAPLEIFRRCPAELAVPACAIGGITLANVVPVIAAGAALLAVITDLFDAPDIAARAAAYQRLFEENQP